ncbi:MAG TPA: GGDEF domain-containing protein [Mesotoga infera]|uniref:Diguanylate cyclase n=1 Tax=Mesotoga infera TaxID=1236046 RepID=A0A7Z7LGV6_9BACT|nr:GGDEF domain-containing protein [Mesotoga infera]MBP8659968.1 GGDEF domain-containing protein [Mesotoga sp.]NLI07462.1 GGDEF domain-containing protein [Thermotogaceae bacterium]SSC13748.1 Diguanylate cyclase [Mesotoga infera]HNR79829.1 GGDEF domain-containing protein [Mesotoga infera]HNS66216.1 GGDEF domain-containing protein [Mesotoga infera]
MSFDEWKSRLEQLAKEGPFAIADIDIDKFAEINSEFGRDCGDRVFEILDRTLRENLPDKLSYVRFGDEFFIYSSEYTLETLFMEMQDLKQTIANLSFECRGKIVRFTVSGSVGEFPRNASTVEKLLNLLSEGMRKAKIGGRGQVIFAPLERESKMVLKSNYYLKSQLDGLTKLTALLGRTESSLLREALDDLLRKYRL